MSKALIIEDSPGLQRVILMRLRDAGYDVSATDNIDDAYSFLNENSDISFIWLDHYLVGDKTGLDLLRSIRNDTEFKGLKDVPIFLVSGLDSDEILNEYTELGIARFFPKASITVPQVINEIIQSLE